MSQVSLGRPEFVPGTPPGHPTAKFLYVIFLYRFFLSMLKYSGWIIFVTCSSMGKSNGGFSGRGVLAIMDLSSNPTSQEQVEVSISSKNSLAITEISSERQLVTYCGKPLPGTPPFAIPKGSEVFGASSIKSLISDPEGLLTGRRGRITIGAKITTHTTFIVGKLSELFAMGPVQFRWPRGVAENSFTKPGFWEHFVDFPRKNSKTQSSLNFL